MRSFADLLDERIEGEALRVFPGDNQRTQRDTYERVLMQLAVDEVFELALAHYRSDPGRTLRRSGQ